MRALHRFALVLSAILVGSFGLRSTAPAGSEVMLVHLACRGGQLFLSGGMISPGNARLHPHPTLEDSLHAELLSAENMVLSAVEMPDVRHLYSQPMIAAELPAGASTCCTPFSLRIPWDSRSRFLRIEQGDGTPIFYGPIDPSFVRLSQNRYIEWQETLSREADRIRTVTPKSPAAIYSPPSGAFDSTTDRLAASLRFLETAIQTRDYASLSVNASPYEAGMASFVIRVIDSLGEPIAKAGVVAVDHTTGKALGGVETDPDGRGTLNIAETKVRLYLFPPYLSSGTPIYARKRIEIDLAGKNGTTLDLVLERGVLVSGTVQTEGTGPSSAIAVTAIDPQTDEALDYARTDSREFYRYTLRLLPGQVRFFVGPRPGSASLLSPPTDIQGDSMTLDFRLKADSLVYIQGIVTDPTGQAVAGARVNLLDSAGNSYLSTYSAADGTFGLNSPPDGWLFLYPNSSTPWYARTLSVSALQENPNLKLPALPPIQFPHAAKPQLGLIYGDAGDPTRLNMVFVGDGYTAEDEPFTDQNQNGVWDGDIYLDENRNGQYDSGEYFYNRDGKSGYQSPEPFQDWNADGTCNRGEQAIFDRNVWDYVRVLLGTPPWPEMLARINFWHIRTISRQSAGSFPEFGIQRETALGTSYGPKSTGFIISVPNAKLTEAVQTLLPEYDHILCISNSPLALGRANAYSGGSLRLKGGNFDNLSTVATHELGHALGLLSDEYSDSTLVDSRYIYKSTEPSGPNITSIPSGSLTKWASELDGSVPYPTPPDLPGVGLFEGAGTYFRGLYRPEYHCMMRLNTPRFCVICNREIRARIVEKSSTHSLNYPLLLFYPTTSSSAAQLTAISLMNPSQNSPLDLGFTAYGFNGKLLIGRNVTNPTMHRLSPGYQSASTDKEIFHFQQPQEGWVRVFSNGPAKGFFLIADPAFAAKMDGTVANPAASADLLLPILPTGSQGSSRFSIVNPSTRSSNVAVSLYSSTGKVLREESRTLSSLGQWLGNIVLPETAWIRIRSLANPPVELMAIGLAEDPSSLAIVPALPADLNTSFLTLPHFASGGEYETWIRVVSLRNRTLDIRALGGEGHILKSQSLSFTAGEQKEIRLSSFLGTSSPASLTTGYLTIQEASAPGAALQGVAAVSIFRYGSASSAAGSSEWTPRTNLTFGHVANDTPAGNGKTFQTGLTLLNPGTTPAGARIRLLDRQGQLLRDRSLTLAPRQKISRMLSGNPDQGAFFAAPLAVSSGYLLVDSDVPLFGFEIFFTTDLELMASVPAQ